MVVVRQVDYRPVALGVVAWAVVVGVCAFIALTEGHLGISSSAATWAYWIAALWTSATGWWLGWRRRMGTAFAAPVLSWIVFVPFAFASEFVRAGFLGGLIRGLGLAVFGGFVASFVEGVLLVAFASLGRLAAAALGRGGPDVVILPPGSG